MIHDDEQHLPDEILAHIFSFLDKRAKLAASSVCKRWMQIFNDYSRLLESVCVFVTQHSLENVEILASSDRKFCFFHFQRLNIDEEWLRVFEKLGGRCRRMSMFRCVTLLDLDDPGRKLQNFTKLWDLEVVDSEAIKIFSHLPALKSLVIKMRDHFLQRELQYLHQVVPLTLKHFYIWGIDSRDENFMEMVYRELRDFIQNRRMCLESLDLCDLQVPDKILDGISKIEGLRLKRFKVSHNFQQGSTIESFCERQRGIVALELAIARCSEWTTTYYVSGNLTDANVVAICTFLPHLEELGLRLCDKVNGSVSAIFKLERLKKLDLYGCRGITDKSFRDALNGLACQKLKNLNLCHTFIERLTLFKLLHLVPSIKEITLSHIYHLNSEWVESLPRRWFNGMTFVHQLKQ